MGPSDRMFATKRRSSSPLPAVIGWDKRAALELLPGDLHPHGDGCSADGTPREQVPKRTPHRQLRAAIESCRQERGTPSRSCGDRE